MRPQGFSTLEALCALMVLNLLGVGLLHWQWQAMQAQREALAHQNAVGLAQDLWQRMQLNPMAASGYQLAFQQTVNSPDCTAHACSPAEWAQADLAEWLAELQVRMPGGQAQLATITTGTDGGLTAATTQLTLAWPSALTGLAATQACPELHRCWHTTWSL